MSDALFQLTIFLVGGAVVLAFLIIALPDTEEN